MAKKTATREVAAVPGSTAASERAAPEMETAPAKKAAAKKAAAKKAAPAGKAAAGKSAAGKAAAEKAAKEAAAGEEPAGRAPAKKTAAKKTAAKKTAAKKTAARKTAARKTAARKTPAEKAPAEVDGAAPAARKTGARKVVAKKIAGTARKTAEDTAGGPATAPPGELAVRPGEEPWTAEEVAEARKELLSEVMRLRVELEASEMAISGLMRDSGDGAGDDQADTGTKNITRESELALAANATSMLEQTERALERLEAGTYGLCENCGKPIGKARMQAFPRATLCVDCKQKQERRH
ncbi:TraR/DksA family transcriptional regulator [Streptomyces sp. NPDC001389]|uniref:TraR/DksA family transcriptional regulator n=1 Tax=Streptomyces sp. NPDC001389 TaxID=3364569 RepID=UPI0036B417B5